MPDILVLVGCPSGCLGTRVILDIHDTMPEAYATKMEVPLDSLPDPVDRGRGAAVGGLRDRADRHQCMHKEVLVGHGIPESKIEARS